MREEEMRMQALQLSLQLLGSGTSNLNNLINTSNKLLAYANGVDLTEGNDSFTKEHVDVMSECYHDPVRFLKELKIQHPVKGSMFLEPYEFQKNMVREINSNKHNLVLAARQMGKTNIIAAYILWYAIFHNDKTICIATGRQVNCLEIFERLRFMFDNLPFFLKPKLVSSNKTSLSFDNGSKIMSCTISPNSPRGMSINMLWIDEAAYISHKYLYDFWSVAQIHFHNSTSKLIISSSANTKSGLFYDLWEKDIQSMFDSFEPSTDVSIVETANKLIFNKILIPYNLHPERDHNWAGHHLNVFGKDQFEKEFECKFKDS